MLKLRCVRIFTLILFAGITVLFFGITAAEEKRIIERYLQIVLRSPKRGIAFDKVFNSYSERNCIPLLLEYCSRQRDTAKTPLETANAETLLGLVYERVNEREKAVECFTRAAELDESSPTAPFYLAENLLILEKFNEAEQALKTALQRNPNRLEIPPILRTLGTVLIKSKKYDAAIDVLQQTLKIGPNNRQTLELLAEGYASAKQFETTSKIVLQLLDIKGDMEVQKNVPQLLEKLSKITEEQNELQTAIQYQELLCSISKSKQHRSRLLSLYVKNGNSEAAFQLFFNLILSSGSVSEQTGYIVKMLLLGEFRAVEKVLDFLEIHQEPHWQIDFCRVLVENSISY